MDISNRDLLRILIQFDEIKFQFFQTGEKVNYCENRKALG